jgi:hypothetical protein
MADVKIDRAAARMAQEHPRDCFQQKGDPDHVIVWTSTCTNAPARWRVYTETEWTPMMRASIAAKFEWLQTHTAYDYKQRLYYPGEPYGRREGAVKIALSLFPKST